MYSAAAGLQGCREGYDDSSEGLSVRCRTYAGGPTDGEGGHEKTTVPSAFADCVVAWQRPDTFRLRPFDVLMATS